MNPEPVLSTETGAPRAPMQFGAGYRLTVLLDPGGVVRSIPEAIGIGGFDRTALIGRHIEDLAATGVRADLRRETWARRLELARARPEPARYVDHPPYGPETAAPRVATTVTPIRLTGNRLDAILVEAHDLTTEREAAAAAALDGADRFRVLVELLPQMLWISRADGAAEYFSPRWSEFTGRPNELLLHDGYRDLIHPDDRERVAAFNRPEDEGKPIEFRLLRSDGVYRWVEAYPAPVRDAQGRVVKWVGGTVDIEGRRALEKRASEHRHQLDAALAVTGFGRYAVYFREPRIDADERYAEIIGCDPQEVMDREGIEGLIAMIHPEDVPRARRALADAMAGEPGDYAVEYRIWRPTPQGPELRHLAALGQVEFDSEGPVRILGVLDDVTDRRQADDLHIRMQKREALGTLAGGLAHDFNNVISAILSNAVLAEAELRVGTSPSTSITEIRQGAERAADLVRRMLDFSREEEPQAIAFSLGDVVREALGLLRPTLPKTTTVEESIAPGLPPMFGEATQLHQVVINLVANAAQSILPGQPGRVQVTLDAVTLDRPGSGVTATLLPGEYLRLQVRDDGEGIPGASLPRIFDPFYTTKPQGQGTGLGLPAVQTIVRSHGGTVAVKSLVGEGTTATVHLPTRKAPAVNGAEAPRSGGTTSGRSDGEGGLAPELRVLFVDDEESLAVLAERAMPHHGCRASVFTDPREALEAFAAVPRAFDVLITDLAMPHLSGLDLIEAVRGIRPELPVILTSGFLTAESRARAHALAVDRIVSKPCSIADLAVAARAVCETGPVTG